MRLGSDKKNDIFAINAEKIRFEGIESKKIEKIFRDMAKDARALYLSSQGFSTTEIANNYRPEFLKQVRDSLRRGIKKYGYNLRNNIEKKHAIFFDAKNKSKWHDLEIKQSEIIEDEDLDEKVNEINNEYLALSALFVANQSENQVDYITNTNIKEMNLAIQQEQNAFDESVARQARNISALEQTRAERISQAFDEDLRQIDRQIATATSQLRRSIDNQDEIIARNIQVNLQDRAKGRSDLIAFQNVGLGESWARQTEAELINDAELLTDTGETVAVTKEWVTILDEKTRDPHRMADGQVVGVNESFIVAGEALSMPRDPNGSMSNIANCRCMSLHEIDTIGNPTKSAKNVNTTPTSEMAKVASRALEWRREFGRGGTAVGVSRARDISNRKSLSKRTINRMISFFARHEVDKKAEGFRQGEKGFPSNGRIAWDLWGGDVGRAWAKRKKREFEG